jgi:hypothetical protein
MVDDDKQKKQHALLSGKNIRRFIGAVFSFAIVLFLGKYLFNNWHSISWGGIHFNFKVLASSYLSLTASFYLSVVAWKMILRSLGIEMRAKAAIWTFGGTTLAKYIPGNVWIVGSRIYLCSEKGIAKSIAGTAILFEMLVTVVAGLWVFIGILPFLVIRNVPTQFWITGCLLPLTLLVLFPNIFLRLLPSFILHRIPAMIDLKISSRYLVIATILYVGVFFAQGSGLWFLINSFYKLPIENLVPIIGIHSGSWVLGFLSFITPSGLGVREGLLSFFLKFYMPLPISIIVSFLARLWSTVFEIFITLFAFTLRK